MTIDEIHISEVVREARAGAKNKEEPVGAVVVVGGRLKGATLYATEIPCRMCLAAAQRAGVRRVFYGVKRKVPAPARIPMVGGILEKECKALRDGKPNC